MALLTYLLMTAICAVSAIEGTYDWSNALQQLRIGLLRWKSLGISSYSFRLSMSPAFTGRQPCGPVYIFVEDNVRSKVEYDGSYLLQQRLKGITCDAPTETLIFPYSIDDIYADAIRFVEEGFNTDCSGECTENSTNTLPAICGGFASFGLHSSIYYLTSLDRKSGVLDCPSTEPYLEYSAYEITCLSVYSSATDILSNDNECGNIPRPTTTTTTTKAPSCKPTTKGPIGPRMPMYLDAPNVCDDVVNRKRCLADTDCCTLECDRRFHICAYRRRRNRRAADIFFDYTEGSDGMFAALIAVLCFCYVLLCLCWICQKEQIKVYKK